MIKHLRKTTPFTHLINEIRPLIVVIFSIRSVLSLRIHRNRFRPGPMVVTASFQTDRFAKGGK